MRKSEKQYLKHRKDLIKEERSLLLKRDKLNKQLREVRSSLYSWDNWLIQ